MLSKWSLTAMAFLSISGGPIGMESAMINSNIWAIQGVCLWIFLTYIIPTAFMTYEMTMYYDLEGANGGPMGWVYKALGRKAGIANGVWDIIDTLIDNATYPLIFTDNLLKMGYVDKEYKLLVSFIMICVTFIINYGELQGISAILLAIFILSPFVGLMANTPINNNFYTESSNDINWDSLQRSFTIIIWSINGYDMVAPYAHMVVNPRESYKFVYGINAIGTYIMMVLAFSLGTYYIHDPNKWYDGSFVTMAGYSGGEYWRLWMGCATCAAAFGVLTAELCSTSYLFVALSKMGFSKKFESPRFNLILNAIILCACIFVNLNELIELSAYLNTLTLQCEIFAWLMTYEPNKYRVAAIICLSVNNIIILGCRQTTCYIALFTSIGLAIFAIWVSEKSINYKKELISKDDTKYSRYLSRICCFNRFFRRNELPETGPPADGL